MASPPFIYCCVPREGIMTFCFWYGLMNLFVLAMIGAFASLSDETYNWLVDFLDLDRDLEDTYLDYLMLIAQTVIGIAYMYGSYLAYKRNFKPFGTLLYFFAADLAWTLWTVCGEFKTAYGFWSKGGSNDVLDAIPSTNLTLITPQQENPTKKPDDVPSMPGFLAFALIFFVIIPFLNKLYVILKMRAYVKYVEYKKDEAELSSTMLEAPKKHPEIIKE